MLEQALLKIQRLARELMYLHETACHRQETKQTQQDTCATPGSDPQLDVPGCSRSKFKGEHVCLADIPTPEHVGAKWIKLFQTTYRKLMIATHPDKHPGRTELFWKTQKARKRNDLGVMVALATDLDVIDHIKPADVPVLKEAARYLEIQVINLKQSGLAGQV